MRVETLFSADDGRSVTHIDEIAVEFPKHDVLQKLRPVIEESKKGIQAILRSEQHLSAPDGSAIAVADVRTISVRLDGHLTVLFMRVGKKFEDLLVENDFPETILPGELDQLFDRYRAGDRSQELLHQILSAYLARTCLVFPQEEHAMLQDLHRLHTEAHREEFERLREDREQTAIKELYELKAKLEGYHIYSQTEAEEFAKVFYDDRSNVLADMKACLNPVVARFYQLPQDVRDEIRKSLVAYRDLYSSLSLLEKFDLGRFYSFVRFLLFELPKGAGVC